MVARCQLFYRIADDAIDLVLAVRGEQAFNLAELTSRGWRSNVCRPGTTGALGSSAGRQALARTTRVGWTWWMAPICPLVIMATMMRTFSAMPWSIVVRGGVASRAMSRLS